VRLAVHDERIDAAADVVDRRVARERDRARLRVHLALADRAELRHVPYRGAGPAIADVVGGQIPYVLSTLTSVLPHIKAGKLKAIAITSLERSPLVPNVPTIAASGFPGYDMDTWVGTFVPRPTPNAIVKTLHDATVEALNSPDVRQRLEAQGTRIISGPPDQLDALVAEDIKRYTKIVRERGIKAE
jgi:tripartite-type tricarboxylate transporter receptor subunit TctC